jgi:hypothetical protein
VFADIFATWKKSPGGKRKEVFAKERLQVGVICTPD